MQQPFLDVDLPLADRRVGKVRVSYALDNAHRLFVTTDRLSAFDRIIAGVPWKGQVLNQLAAWWFAETADIVANHVARTATPCPTRMRWSPERRRHCRSRSSCAATSRG
jgi:phosphoribosylaminoimidazole-succinocarboxamide synthase